MAAKHEQPFDFDISKFMGEFRLPVLDVETFVTSQRRNLEALTQANRIAYDGLQAVVKRQVEIARQAMDEVGRATKEIAEPGTAQDKAVKQTELAKDAVERGLGNLRELADMIAKANGEAFDLLNQRFAQGMDELRDAITRSVRH